MQKRREFWVEYGVGIRKQESVSSRNQKDLDLNLAHLPPKCQMNFGELFALSLSKPVTFIYEIGDEMGKKK